MLYPFVGQIVAYAGSYPPKGWAICDGSLLAIRSNTALFSLLGTNYGGDGKVTFGLPNLGGTLAIGAGMSTSGTSYVVGETVGADQATLTLDQLAAHGHVLDGSLVIPANPSDDKDSTSPAGHYLSAAATDIYSNSANGVMGPVNLNVQVAPAGNNMPFPLGQPSNGLLYCIALEGIFPQRP